VGKPWMDPGRKYDIQQDDAPAHNSKATHGSCLTYLLEAWPKEIRPLNSPDCNPLANHGWSVCGLDVIKAPHYTGASLMARVLEVMGILIRDTVAKAYRRFFKRIEAVVEAGSDFVE